MILLFIKPRHLIIEAEANCVSRFLGNSGTQFFTGSAAEQDLSRGSIFKLYYPFKGDTLATVIDSLKAVAQMKQIHIVARSISEELDECDWLESLGTTPFVNGSTIYVSSLSK